jgi:hypothetical protein
VIVAAAARQDSTEDSSVFPDLRFAPFLFLSLFALQFAPAFTVAQGNGNGNGNGTVSGISIDANGVVRPEFTRGKAPGLIKQQMQAFATSHLPDDMQAFSPQRKVSLVKLEQNYAARADAGEETPADMLHLAGLQRIDYVFVDPQGKDVVLAGPAEGFAPDASGRMRGLTTGRPPIRIDDLMVALRSVLRGDGSIGCSIDPDAQRLATLQNYVRDNSTPVSTSGARRRYQQMAQILGLENISVWGIPDDSHFAQVLVEADYRMKRISLGAEPSGVKGIRSHLSLLVPMGNSMQRWWFAPYYEAIHAADDGTAYQIVGQRAQLLSQEERVDAGGGRSDSAFTRASTQKFAQLFTEHFPELVEASPVFAELQNLFDLAVVSALFRKEKVFERTGWQAEVFLDPQRAEIASFPVPRQVPSEALTKAANRGTMLGLIGGVTLNPLDVVANVQSKGTPAAQDAAGVRARALLGGEDNQRWWWD